MAEPPTGRPLVRAAGGVVWRERDHDVQVVLVHRPKYGDWTFPKGKLDPGETERQAALREVEEETGFRCVLGRRLRSTSYADAKGRPKQVDYWAMRIEGGEFRPNDEVDELRWVTVGQARELLSYGHDLDVLTSFTEKSPD
jgi:8-oxo-dGTP pyrophosphatase MutT (NUDIX family)